MPDSDEPRLRRNGEAADIVDGLSHWYWWGGQLLDEIKGTEEMFARDPNHWIVNLGGTEESARGQLFKEHYAKHQTWAQALHAYLRDRIGRGWADRFDAERERTVQGWLERELALLDTYLTEFRQLAARASEVPAP